MEEYFKDLQREVAATARECEMYGDLCKGHGYDFDEPITHKNLHTVPFIPTQFFKISLEQYYALLRVPQEQIASYHVSSSTSQDPSVVGRTASDIAQTKANWVTAWRKFLNLENTDYCLNFAPGHTAMKAVARRSGAEVKGRRLYLDSLFRDPIIPQEIMPAYPPRRYRRRKTDSEPTSSGQRKTRRKRRRRSKVLLRSRSTWEKFRRRLRGKGDSDA